MISNYVFFEGAVFIFRWNTWKKRRKCRLGKIMGFFSFSLYLFISISISLCEIRGRINLAVWPIILWCAYSYVRSVATRIRLHLFHKLRDEKVKERLIFIIRSSLVKINSYVFCLSTSRFAARHYRASFDPCDEYRPFGSTITNWVMRWNTWCWRLVHDRRSQNEALRFTHNWILACLMKIIVS